MRDDGSTGLTGPFSLTPEEHAVGGIAYRDGRLRLRPSVEQCANAAMIGGTFAVIGVIGLLRGPWGLALMGLGCAVPIARYLNCRVDAAGGEIRVVNKWRRHRLSITEVAGAKRTAFAPEYGFFPLGGGDWWGNEFDAGVIRRTDGRSIRCDALVLKPRRKELRTSVDVKIAVLQRWLDAQRAS